MAEEIVLKIDVQSEDGSKSLKALKQEFKETQKELDGLVVGSQKYVQTLQKLGGIKDQIGDLNQTINAFNPEGKVQALGNAISGVASGFQAAVGATALFGAESEELNKTLVKVQATMAFVEGIKGVIALGDSFAVLNTIIAANPIASATIAITALTAGVYALVNANEDLIESEKKIAKINQDKFEKHVEHEKFIKSLATDRLQHELNLAKARGASENDLYKLEKKILDQKIYDLKVIKEERGNLTKDENLELVKLYRERELLQAEHENKKSEIKREKAKSDKAFEDSLFSADRQAEDKMEQAKKRIEEERRANKEWQDQQQKEIKEASDQRIRWEKYEQEQTIALRRESYQATQALTEAVFAVRLSSAKKGSAEEQKILKQQFNVNKAFQIANAGMNGIQAIQAIAASAVDPTGVTTALRIAAQATLTAANIAKIASTQFNATGGSSDSGGGTSVGVASASSGLPSQPAPQIAQPTATRLNPDGTVQATQSNMVNTVKAIVVESDVTGTQKRVSTIKDRATLE